MDFYFETGIAISLNEKYEKYKNVGVGSEMQSQHIKSIHNHSQKGQPQTRFVTSDPS